MDEIIGKDLGIDYSLVYKDLDNILEEVVFTDDYEKIMCEAIANTIESTAAELFFKEKIVSLPYIGNIQIHLLRRRLAKQRKTFIAFGKVYTKEEFCDKYDKMFKKTYVDLRREEVVKRHKKRVGDKRYVLWTDLIRTKGKNYAKCYMKFFDKLYITDTKEE